MQEYWICESRVEDKCNKGGSNTTEQMQEQTGEGTDSRGSLDIGQTVEPVEKALNTKALL